MELCPDRSITRGAALHGGVDVRARAVPGAVRPMSGRLAGRSILVTGSTGIAAAAGLRFAAEGAAIFVVSRTEAHAADLAGRIRAAGGEADHRAAELTDGLATDAAVAAAVERFGRIDGLLSVAGGSGRAFGDGPIHELSPDGWDRTLALNLASQALVCAAVVRQMLAGSRSGPAVSAARSSSMSSVLASHPVPELFATHAYAAAKGGIVGLGHGHGGRLRAARASGSTRSLPASPPRRWRPAPPPIPPRWRS